MASETKSNTRSAAFVSLSILAHAGLIGVLFFTPSEKPEPIETAGKGEQTIFIDNLEPGNQAPAAAEIAATEPAAPAVAEAVPEPVAPPTVEPAVETPKPAKVAAIMAKPKTHGLPDKKRSAPKQPARPTLPPEEESKKLETVADSNVEVSEAADTPALSASASDSAEDLAVSKSEEDAESVAPIPDVGSASEPESTALEEAPAAVAVTTPQASPPQSSRPAMAPAAAPAQATGQGAGPADGPRGSGTGYGAPAGNGTQVVSAEMRNPLPGNPKPVYPVQDRLSGRQGTTTLIAHVDNDGSISDIAITKKSGSDLMDRASVEALKKWKFAKGPAVAIGKSFAFQLTNQPEIARAQLGR